MKQAIRAIRIADDRAPVRDVMRLTDGRRGSLENIATLER